MEPTPQMSATAQQRMASMLPDMLASVRTRRRRRQVVRAALFVAPALLLSMYFWSSEAPITKRTEPMAQGQTHVAAPLEQTAFVCEVVRNVPNVLAQFRQNSTVPADWFVTDEGLQQFLREGQRPDGIIRISGKAMISAVALDPFPSAE